MLFIALIDWLKIISVDINLKEKKKVYMSWKTPTIMIKKSNKVNWKITEIKNSSIISVEK